MDVQLAVLADHANLSMEGKLNIMGVFDVGRAHQVPITWPLMFFCARFHVGEADGYRHKFTLRVLDDDSHLVAGPAAGEPFLGFLPPQSASLRITLRIDGTGVTQVVEKIPVPA
jgi:hypothetical protein